MTNYLTIDDQNKIIKSYYFLKLSLNNNFDHLWITVWRKFILHTLIKMFPSLNIFLFSNP